MVSVLVEFHSTSKCVFLTLTFKGHYLWKLQEKGPRVNFGI